MQSMFLILVLCATYGIAASEDDGLGVRKETSGNGVFAASIPFLIGTPLGRNALDSPRHLLAKNGKKKDKDSRRRNRRENNDELDEDVEPQKDDSDGMGRKKNRKKRGCKVDPANGVYCCRKKDCAGGQKCDRRTNTCVSKCATEGPGAVECCRNRHCKDSGKPKCDKGSNTCVSTCTTEGPGAVQCCTDQHCTDSSFPKCDKGSNTCVCTTEGPKGLQCCGDDNCPDQQTCKSNTCGSAVRTCEDMCGEHCTTRNVYYESCITACYDNSVDFAESRVAECCDLIENDCPDGKACIWDYKSGRYECKKICDGCCNPYKNDCGDETCIYDFKKNDFECIYCQHDCKIVKG